MALLNMYLFVFEKTEKKQKETGQFKTYKIITAKFEMQSS